MYREQIPFLSGSVYIVGCSTALKQKKFNTQRVNKSIDYLTQQKVDFLIVCIYV